MINSFRRLHRLSKCVQRIASQAVSEKTLNYDGLLTAQTLIEYV